MKDQPINKLGFMAIFDILLYVAIYSLYSESDNQTLLTNLYLSLITITFFYKLYNYIGLLERSSMKEMYFKNSICLYFLSTILLFSFGYKLFIDSEIGTSLILFYLSYLHIQFYKPYLLFLEMISFNELSYE